MKPLIIGILSIFTFRAASGQQLDSLFFNLYTDSLKKGTYNYINVEGKYSDGKYLPLGAKDLVFSASGGVFENNSLFIDSSFKEEKVIIHVQSIRNRRLNDKIVVYIKQHENNERLPTMNEVLNTTEPTKRKSSRKR